MGGLLVLNSNAVLLISYLLKTKENAVQDCILPVRWYSLVVFGNFVSFAVYPLGAIQPQTRMVTRFFEFFILFPNDVYSTP